MLFRRKGLSGAVKTGFDEAAQLHFAQDSSRRVYVSDVKRLELYQKGIQHRREHILNDYCLPHDLIRPNDLVIDIGANIGEIGMWVEEHKGNYIAFEPDQKAFSALRKNVESNSIFDVALSDECGTATFYLNTSEADSSLYQPETASESVTVKTAKLDSFLKQEGITKSIRLLKLEAEGYEPEILDGAKQTLQTVEYLTVDAGPERGGDNTVPGVFRALDGAGFEVLACFLRRGTFLFGKKGRSQT